jgi:hypothetical protein
VMRTLLTQQSIARLLGDSLASAENGNADWSHRRHGDVQAATRRGILE